MKFGANLNWIQNTSADTIGGDSPRGTLYFDAAMTSYNGESAGYAYPAFLLGTPVQIRPGAFRRRLALPDLLAKCLVRAGRFQSQPVADSEPGSSIRIQQPADRALQSAGQLGLFAANQLVVATKDNRSPGTTARQKRLGPAIRVCLVARPRKDQHARRLRNFLLAGILERSSHHPGADLPVLCQERVCRRQQPDSISALSRRHSGRQRRSTIAERKAAASRTTR